LWAQYGPKVDSAFKRNGYQEYLLVPEGGQYIGLTKHTTFMCWLYRNSGSLNLLEP